VHLAYFLEIYTIILLLLNKTNNERNSRNLLNYVAWFRLCFSFLRKKDTIKKGARSMRVLETRVQKEWTVKHCQEIVARLSRFEEDVMLTAKGKVISMKSLLGLSSHLKDTSSKRDKECSHNRAAVKVLRSRDAYITSTSDAVIPPQG
jgi:hypothetical protein